jgi:hypothetical protein
MSGLVFAGLSAQPAAGNDYETVTMPFACGHTGGRLDLQHSGDRTYRLIGPHERQSLRVCAGRGARNCRNLEIHRFTFDCGGVRVSWIAAATESARGKPWRASVAAGRLTLRAWPDDPEKGRRLPLTLPAGFAPAPSGGFRFGAGMAADHSAVPAKPKKIGEPTPRPFVAPPVERKVAAIPALENPAEGGGRMEATAPPLAGDWAPVVSYGGEARSPAHRPAAWSEALRQALLATLGLATLLFSATAVAARQGVALHIPGKWPNAVQGWMSWPPTRSDDKRADKTTSPPPPPKAKRLSSAHLENGFRAAGACDRATLARAAAGSAMAPDDSRKTIDDARYVTETLLSIVRQMIADFVSDGPMRDVLVADLATIEMRLDAIGGVPNSANADVGGLADTFARATADLERLRTLVRIEHARALDAAAMVATVPRSLAEACAYLGVNPRAGDAVAKKVVDALRQNWHPDLAIDEPDRIQREDRTKRINAAWDMIRDR